MVLVRFILLWFWLDVLLFLLLGISESSPRNVITSVILLLVLLVTFLTERIFKKFHWSDRHSGVAYLFAVFFGGVV